MKSKCSAEIMQRAAKLKGQNKTGEEIAAALGVSRRTVVRWLSNPEMQPVIERERTIRQARFWRNVRRIKNGMMRQKNRQRA